MKLKKCYVFSFGKLNGVSFDLTDGLNTFKEDNGWGKSTLASFIKAIFYGLNDSKSKNNVAENERTKYKPWNSTQKFGGYIEFEWGGKGFKLERYFGNKQSEDTVSLTDLATGKVYSDTDNLGSRIFQIDEEGFLSTTYFSQKDFQVKSNTSITSKFNSTCEIQDSDAFDNAVSKLEEKAKTYKKTGDKGLIADTRREIFSVGEQIQSATLASKTAISIKQNVEELKKEVDELKRKTDNLTAKVTDAGKTETIELKKQQYKSYLDKKQQKQLELNQLDQTLNGLRPSEQEIEAYINCCIELDKVAERESLLASDINQLKTQPVFDKKQPNNLPFLIIFITAILSLFVGVGLIFAQKILVSVLLISLAVILGISAFLVRYLQANKSARLSPTSNEFLDKKISDYNEYKSIRESYEKNIDEFLNKFSIKNASRFDALSTILTSVKTLGSLSKEVAEITSVLADYEKDKTLFENTDGAPNLSAIKKELALVQDEYAKKANELARKSADAKYYQDKADAIPELEEKKTELQNKLEQYTDEYKIILKTLELLGRADENLKTKYRAPLQDSLNRYLSLISGKKRTALIDIDLNVTIEENGGAKQTEYYSKGEQNLFEICKRFALTDVLFTGEKPFIILDDPFYNLDDEKLSLALELIKKLSNEYQILYFICHESRRA